MNNEIIEEMYNRRSDMIKKLSTIVHPLYVERIAKILHYSWQENLAEAESLSDELNFYPIDFVSLSCNEKEFEDLFIKELRELYVENYA
jgi:hypothetical protein